MKILMISSEAHPYAKAGGLADAVSCLAAALAELGHDVRLVLPRYYFIDPGVRGLLKHPAPLGVPIGESEEWAGIYESPRSSSFTTYFIDHERCFGRDGIYGTRLEPDFRDNVERFSLLCRGAYQLCRLLRWWPDIVHTHDWPTALAMVYLRFLERQNGFARARGVFSIHNMGYQGVYPKEWLPKIGLSWEYYLKAGFEYYDKINLLKSGIINADAVTSVSPTYAREIYSPRFGHNLEGVLQDRGDLVVGILNGMDYETWNPENDPYLGPGYTADDLRGKALFKRRLQDETRLPAAEDIPLIGMVSRLVEQKGFKELCDPHSGALRRLLRMRLQIVILGTGERWIEEELARLAWKFPNLKVILQFSERLAHLITAGSDFFLMPSSYEPCGLSQMYALRYGTVPIVSRTGGLADTVKAYDEASGEGTGLFMDPLSPPVIVETVERACRLFSDQADRLCAMRRAGMGQRYSWDRSAREYQNLFSALLERPSAPA